MVPSFFIANLSHTACATVVASPWSFIIVVLHRLRAAMHRGFVNFGLIDILGFSLAWAVCFASCFVSVVYVFVSFRVRGSLATLDLTNGLATARCLKPLAS